MKIPVIENIHQKVYKAVSQPGALDMSTWHTCDTTHCRAGWVIHLAGEAGYKLQKQTDYAFAAMQIYKASSPQLPVGPNKFFGGNAESLADMQEYAEKEIQANKSK